ncbi:MAG: TonB-dependent receptor [Betaproteobacteria bacterium]|nr:MAG: TonB-dependent receptor [Betaproteobacteria bacterium]
MIAQVAAIMMRECHRNVIAMTQLAVFSLNRPKRTFRGIFMIQKKQLVVAIAATFVTSGAAFAQQATQAQKVEKVEITGSLIKRVDAETAAPVQIITRQDIERSGAVTIAEVLKMLPATNGGTFNEAGVASFSPGSSAASLRGLGGAATLVLINGRRVAPFGFASGGQVTFVDLNSIPLDATERIEILKDGASAIYGSEAMAGVINIIMRKDYKGGEVRVGGSISSRSDAQAVNAGLTFGVGSIAADGYNVFGSFNYRKQDAVYGVDRPNTATSDFRRFGSIDRRSTYSNPGNVYNVANTTFIAAMPGCSPVGTSADGALNGRCFYEFANVLALIPDSERMSAFFSGTKTLGTGWELFSDLSVTKNVFNQRSASYNVATYGYNGAILRADHPQNTWGKDVAVRYRLNDRLFSTDVDSRTLRLVAGIRGAAGAWDVESAVMYSGSNTDVVSVGHARDSVLDGKFFKPGTGDVRNDVRLGALSPELIAELYPVLKDNGKTSVTSIDARMSREFGRLSGGPMGVALGADLRRESFVSVPDALTQAGEISTLGAASADGSRRAAAAFFELQAPVLPGVETQWAGRYDHYSDFGGKFTPKVSAKWKATKQLALRSTYAEGFRAPSLTETSGSPVTGFYNNIRDPKLCPTPNADNPNCSLQVRGVSGSNPDLKPETSKSFTLGAVFEPTDNFSVAIDYYNIKRKNEISSLDVEYLLANESLYPRYVTRNAAGELTGLNLPYENLGSTNARGFDFDVKAKVGLGEYGRLTLNANINYMPTYDIAPVKGVEALNYAGTWLQPRERTTLGATWERGPWDATVTWNRTGSYLRAFTPSDLSCALSAASIAQGLCAVSRWSTTDLVVRYRGFQKTELTFAVRNLDDRQPPLDQRRETRFTWYQPTYHNALGRYMSVNAKYEFR